MSAFVADGGADVDTEIVAPRFRRHIDQFFVAFLRQFFVQIQVQRGTAVQIIHQLPAVQQEFVQRVDEFVFHHIEIGIVAVALFFHAVAVFFVPLRVFRAQVFGRHEFGVEFVAVFFGGFLIGVIDDFQFSLHEFDVFVVVADMDALRFRRFHHPVNADGQELFVQRDESRIVNR